MTRTEVNNALAGILQAQIDIPEHLQANQVMLDYTEQLVTGAITGNTWMTDKPNYYTKSQTDTYLNAKADLVGGLVPSNQLPSFVDDVLEFSNLASFPTTGTTGKIYVATDTNFSYRWSGSTYIQIISGNFILNQTSSAQPSSGFWIDGVGRVGSLGIGIAPSYPLHISGHTSSISVTTSHSINSGAHFIANAGQGTFFGSTITNAGYYNGPLNLSPLQDIIFKPGGNEKARFTTGGGLELGVPVGTTGATTDGLVTFKHYGGGTTIATLGPTTSSDRIQFRFGLLQLGHLSGDGVGTPMTIGLRNPVNVDLGGQQYIKVRGQGNGTTPSFIQLYSSDPASTSNNIGIDFRLARTTGGETVFSRIATYSSNVGNSTYQGYLSFQLANAAAVAEQMKLSHNGVLTVNDSILVGTGNSGVSFQLGTFGAADYYVRRSGTALTMNSAGAIAHTIGGNSWYTGLAATGHSWYDGAATPALLMRLTTSGQLSLYNIPNATTDTDKFLVSDGGVIKYRTGTELAGDLGLPVSWSVSGNTGTDSSLHFIGTADDQDVMIKRNNVEIVKLFDNGVTVSPLAGEGNRMVYVNDEGTLTTTGLPPGTIITEEEDYASSGGNLSSYFGITTRYLTDLDFTVDENEEVEFDYQMYSAYASSVTFTFSPVASSFDKLDVTVYRKSELEDDWVEDATFNLGSWSGVSVISETYLRVKGRLRASTADTVRANISTTESSMDSGGVSDVTLNVTRYIAGSPFGADADNSGWSLTGNTGTDSDTDFIGTLDDVDVVFKRNEVEKIRLTDSVDITGQTNIGGEVFDPSHGLDINYSYDDSGIVDVINVDVKPEGFHVQSIRGSNPANTNVYITGSGLEVALSGEGYSANCNLFDYYSTFGNSFDDGVTSGASKIDFSYDYGDIGSTAAIIRSRQDIDQEMSVEVRPESVSIKYNETEAVKVANNGEVTVSDLAGSDNRIVIADEDGVLRTQSFPTGGTFTPSIAGELNTVTGSTVVSGMMYSESLTGDIVTCSGVVILQSTGSVLTNVVKFTLPTGLADNLFGVASAVDGTSGIVILEDNQAKLMVLAPDTAIRYMYYQFQYRKFLPL